MTRCPVPEMVSPAIGLRQPGWPCTEQTPCPYHDKENTCPQQQTDAPESTRSETT